MRKLPKREVEICARLREAREEILEITQASCAEQIGLDRSTLANYETARTPLRYEVALRFCRQLIISEEWLATGRFNAIQAEGVRRGIPAGEPVGGMRMIHVRQCLDLLSDPASLHIKPGTRFSAAYDNVLAVRYAELLKVHFYQPLVRLTDADGSELATNFLNAVHERHVIMLEHEGKSMGYMENQIWRLYTRRVFECSDLVFRKVYGLLTGAKLPPEYLSPLEWLRAVSTDPSVPIGELLQGEEVPGSAKPSQDALDIGGLASDKSDVQIKSLPELITNLKRLTSKRGAKAALARKLGVSRQAVDQWLKGSTTPSSDVLIELMRMK